MTKIHPVVPPTQIPHRDLLQLEVLPDEEQIRADIERLRRERNAVILAHNYQRPEVQTIADFVGDSLGLSRQAAKPRPKSSCSPGCISWPRRRPS